jgi:hypothetical protein
MGANHGASAVAPQAERHTSCRERKKERPTPVARRALRGPLQARATESCRAPCRSAPSFPVVAPLVLLRLQGPLSMCRPIEGRACAIVQLCS